MMGKLLWKSLMYLKRPYIKKKKKKKKKKLIIIIIIIITRYTYR